MKHITNLKKVLCNVGFQHIVEKKVEKVMVDI